MYTAGTATKLTGLSYRQIDHIIRQHHFRPSGAPACGRGSVRRFSERDLVALRVVKDILAAGHELGPFMHLVRFVQRARGLPPFRELDGKLLVAGGREVRVSDGATPRLSRALGARRVVHVVDVGAAAHHVRRRLEQLNQAGK